MLYLFLLPAVLYTVLFDYMPMYGIQIAFKENEQPYDENKVYFPEKVAAAKELFSKLGHPKDFLPKITK